MNQVVQGHSSLTQALPPFLTWQLYFTDPGYPYQSTFNTYLVNILLWSALLLKMQTGGHVFPLRGQRCCIRLSKGQQQGLWPI